MGSEVVLSFWQAHYFRSAFRSKGIDSPYYIPLLSLFSIGQEQLSSVSCKRSDNESQIQPDIAEHWAHLGASQNTSFYRSSFVLGTCRPGWSLTVYKGTSVESKGKFEWKQRIFRHRIEPAAKHPCFMISTILLFVQCYTSRADRGNAKCSTDFSASQKQNQ